MPNPKQTKPKQSQKSKGIKITKRNYKQWDVDGQGYLFNLKTGEIANHETNVSYGNFTDTLEESEKPISYKNLYAFKWNKSHKFAKVYQVMMREHVKDLDVYSKSFVLSMQFYLKKWTNEILYKGNPPNNKELSEMFNMSEHSIKKSIADLVNRKMIVVEGRTLSRRIFVNPELMLNGDRCLKSTIRLFYPEYKS